MKYLLKKVKLFAVLSIAVVIGLAGCDSEINSPDSSQNNRTDAVLSQSNSTNGPSQKMINAAKKLKADAKKYDFDLDAANKRIAELTSQGSNSMVSQDVLNSAINGDEFECGPTDLNAWANDNLLYANFGDLLFVVLNGIDQFPQLYALLFEKERNPRQTYGYNGEYTRQIYRAARTVKRFWDVNLRDVQVVAMHGRILSDITKVRRLVDVLYTGSDEALQNFSQDIVDLVTSDPIYNNGDAPLFSFNAVSYSPGPILVGGPDEPGKVIMGDGILAGMDAIGLGRAAPQAILAHEVGHQVQYALNVFENDTLSDPAESTRRTELMADALAAYYLGHKRGAAFNWDRVKTFMLSDFNVGDCSFESAGHHGTPNQRLRAGKFGFNQAENADRRVGKISAAEFVRRFDAALPEITAPDAEDAPTDVTN